MYSEMLKKEENQEPEDGCDDCNDDEGEGCVRLSLAIPEIYSDVYM